MSKETFHRFNRTVLLSLRIGVVNTSKETIVIRGVSNLEQPLYVVNGEIIKSEKAVSISPEDIKSMSVLKGEKAVAKYGEKGRRGVRFPLNKPIFHVLCFGYQPCAIYDMRLSVINAY